MNKTEKTSLNARQAYGRLWREWLAPHWAKLLIALFFMLIVALATAGYAKFMEWVIAALESKSFAVIWWGPLGIIALTLTKGIGHYSQQIVQNKTHLFCCENIRCFLIETLQNHQIVAAKHVEFCRG